MKTDGADVASASRSFPFVFLDLCCSNCKSFRQGLFDNGAVELRANVFWGIYTFFKANSHQ